MRIEAAQPSTSKAAAYIHHHPLIAFAGFTIAFGWLPLLFSTVLPQVPLLMLD